MIWKKVCFKLEKKGIWQALYALANAPFSIQQGHRVLANAGDTVGNVVTTLQDGLLLRTDTENHALATLIIKTLTLGESEYRMGTQVLEAYTDSKNLQEATTAFSNTIDTHAILQGLLSHFTEQSGAVVIDAAGVVQQGVGCLTELPKNFNPTLICSDTAFILNQVGEPWQWAAVLSIPLATNPALWLLVVNTNVDYQFDSIFQQRAQLFANVTTTAFNNAQAVQQRQHLSRYMAPSVVEKLMTDGMTDLGGATQTATVVMVDVRNFTQLTKRLGAVETVRFLNRYYALVVNAVRDGGIVDKFLGDGVLAMFGIPFASENDADTALQSCIAILTQARKTLPNIQLGIGISTGTVIVGNVGTPERMEFTAIGDAVNVASKLQNLCKELGEPLLLTADTYTALSPLWQARCTETGHTFAGVMTYKLVV